MVRVFARLWVMGLVRPRAAFVELSRRPAPAWGLIAVLVRFLVTSLLVILPLHLMGREPFTPPYLTFVAVQRYYLAEIFFLPVLGLALWLLMSASVHVTLRLSHRAYDVDRVLNVVGFGMLIPMPVLWAADWLLLATGRYHLPWPAITHGVVELWEILLFGIGFRYAIGVGRLHAALTALLAGVIYVSLAMIFAR